MIKYKLFTAFLLGLTTFNHIQGFGKKTFFATRSHSVNAVREMVGWQDHIHKCDQDSIYSSLSLTAEYSRSFSPDKIAQFLFGCEKLVFSGSRVQDRVSTDILADYFGLPADFKSTVCFEPQITNFLWDLNWYLGLDCVLPGMYLRAHIPVVHTKWDLNMLECVAATGQAFHPAGYLGMNRLERSALPENVREVFRGNTKFGDMREPLRFGKIFGRQSLTRVAELQIALGWNIFCSDWYNFGLFVRAAAPTGNSPDGEFLFEPIAGNMDHWELGGGFTTRVQLWESEDTRDRVMLYIDLNITHLFDTTFKRSYDLKKNGSGSRYMLLEAIDSPSSNLQIGGAAPNNIVAPNQYKGRLVHAVNHTTLESTIGIDVQADLVIKLAYKRDTFEFDFGYNFWGRSREKLQCRQGFPENCFAVKGDAQIYGFTTAVQVGSPVSLNATQSCATINAGQSDGNFVTPNQFRNLNADNATLARDGNNALLTQLAPPDQVALGPLIGVQAGEAGGSNPAVLLANADIDECSGLLPHAISHKFFVHASNYWTTNPCVTPFIGGGLSIEWACPDPCENSAHSQWAVWLKGGLSY